MKLTFRFHGTPSFTQRYDIDRHGIILSLRLSVFVSTSLGCHRGSAPWCARFQRVEDAQLQTMKRPLSPPSTASVTLPFLFNMSIDPYTSKSACHLRLFPFFDRRECKSVRSRWTALLALGFVRRFSCKGCLRTFIHPPPQPLGGRVAGTRIAYYPVFDEPIQPLRTAIKTFDHLGLKLYPCVAAKRGWQAEDKYHVEQRPHPLEDLS